MDRLLICRVCLSENIHRTIVNTHLQMVYERLAQIPLQTNDLIPMSVCYMCYALLNKSYKLMLRCLRADSILTQMLSQVNCGDKVENDAKLSERLNLSYSYLFITPTQQNNIESDTEDDDDERTVNDDQDFETQDFQPSGTNKHSYTAQNIVVQTRTRNYTKTEKELSLRTFEQHDYGKEVFIDAGSFTPMWDEGNYNINPLKTELDHTEEALQSNEQVSSTVQCDTQHINKNLDYCSDGEDLASKFGVVQMDSDIQNAETKNRDDGQNSLTNKPDKTKNIVATDKPDGVVKKIGARKKRRNIKAERKKLKDSGQEYTQYNGKLVESKRVQPNPCTGKKCGNNCGSITEEKRKLVFEHFWKLQPEQRKEWIKSMSQRTAIKRKRVFDSQKRTATYKYFINEGEGKRSVCLQFLALTINLSQRYIYYTVSQSGRCKDMRGRCEPTNKTKESVKNTVINFIKSLPGAYSRHRRKDRLYLPQVFKNWSNLYQIYKKQHIEQGIDVVSNRIFRNIINENFNSGFHVPKKDKCLKCLTYERSRKSDPIIRAAKSEHKNDIKISFARLKAHQNMNKTDPCTLCASFDLEKTLYTPHGNNDRLHYFRRLAVYNFCVYESGTSNVYCYYWDEINGQRGANEISTVLNRYINTVDKRGNIKNLLLYCDCCTDRNRNQTTLAMIHSTLQTCKNIETIQINFLLTGHNCMPMDTVHSIIEKNFKNFFIYVPSQWYTVFTMARQDPMPYIVEMMSYKDFQKWDEISKNYFKQNPTEVISKIRVAIFKKGVAEITVTFSMDETANSEVILVQHSTRTPDNYENQLPISELKFRDLDKLCKDKVIPAAFHIEYMNIPFSNSIKDILPDTDVEDDSE